MSDRFLNLDAVRVRALLDGRMSQVRRVIVADVPPAPAMDAIHPKNEARHPAPYLDAYCGQPMTKANPRGMSDRWCWWTRDDRPGCTFKVPFVPGDRLWVREAWCHTGDGVWSVGDVDRALDGKLIYRADDDGSDPGIKWFSAELLSRRRSRLTLIVTEVRVERLQDISEADAVAEGLKPDSCAGQRLWDPGAPHGLFSDPRVAYRMIWQDIHGPDAWAANPWVAAISFTTHRANIDALDGGAAA